jgi:osmotically-inducible protein OsmY
MTARVFEGENMNISMHHFAMLAALGALLTLPGCGPAAVAGAAATTATVATQDRTTGEVFDDMSLKAKISNKYFQTDLNDLFKNVDVDVIERRVFLTGSVNKPETAIKAVELAWQVPGIAEVVNEMQVEDKSGFVDRARDLWIQAQINSRLMFTKGIKNTNYNVEVVNGVVYLMGIAQNAEELRQVTWAASRVKYVQKVVSHVVMRDDPRRRQLPAS